MDAGEPAAAVAVAPALAGPQAGLGKFPPKIALLEGKKMWPAVCGGRKFARGKAKM